jgi:hypothetical protein
MTHTARATVVAQRIQTLLSEKVADVTFFDPPIRAVYYGDQDKIPYSPTLCVEAGIKRRSWPPVPTLRTENNLEVTVITYHARIGDGQQTRLEADRLSEAVEEFLNIYHYRLLDASGSDLVIHGHVVENEPGYVRRGNTLFHAARLTWRGITKTQITVAG